MNNNIVENYEIQDLRNVNLGVPHVSQPDGSLQLANAGSRPIKLILTDKGDEWKYIRKDRSVGPEALHMSGDGIDFQGTKYPYVELNPNEWIILELPSGGKAFTIYPRSLCEGTNCLSGSNPTSQPGFYRVSGDWQRPWPNGGGYTICSSENGCNSINPAAGTTKIEGGKDMNTDISMVDGYNHSVKMEISTEINDGIGNVRSKNVTVVANPQDCNYGIRNYGSDTSKGMLGCSNTFKDANQQKQISWSQWSGADKPRYQDLTFDRQSGYCNFGQVPWNGCSYPCAEAGNPDIPNWQGPCYAPSREYCKTVHRDNYIGGSPDYFGDKTQGSFTAYCFSHDDDNSSPELKYPYKLKLTFGDGVVGKPFSPVGCDWSTGGCANNPTPPSNQKWYCFNNKCQLLDVPQIGLQEYNSKEECVRNSDCINFAKNWYCENNECKFDGNVDTLDTYNICRSSGCGGARTDCKEGCDQYANPRAICSFGQYCPGSGCCDDINPNIHPDPPKNCKRACDYKTGQYCPAGNVCPETNCCEYY